MDVLVTGATGFVGANVARLLVADGYRVRVLARPTSSLQTLSGCRVEIFPGDILDPHLLAPAVRGCSMVFHVAADYRLWAKATTWTARAPCSRPASAPMSAAWSIPRAWAPSDSPGTGARAPRPPR